MTVGVWDACTHGSPKAATRPDVSELGVSTNSNATVVPVRPIPVSGLVHGSTVSQDSRALPSSSASTGGDRLAPPRRSPRSGSSPAPAVVPTVSSILRRKPIKHPSTPGAFVDDEHPDVVLTPEVDRPGQYRTATGLLISWTDGVGYAEVVTGAPWTPAVLPGASGRPSSM